MAYETLGSCRY